MSCGQWIVTPDKFLRGEEVAVLRAALAMDAAAGDRYAVRNAAIIETLLGTGLRISEVCALGDLFLDSGACQVLVRRGKGGKSRLVAIADVLAKYIRDFIAWKTEAGELVGQADPLFRSERGGRLCRSAVHRISKAALGRAGLPTRWGVHGTRHSYAVEVYRKTRDLRLTQRQLGHSSPVITTVHVNLLDDDLRLGVEKVWAQAQRSQVSVSTVSCHVRLLKRAYSSRELPEGSVPFLPAPAMPLGRLCANTRVESAAERGTAGAKMRPAHRRDEAAESWTARSIQTSRSHGTHRVPSQISTAATCRQGMAPKATRQLNRSSPFIF